jgi:uncharacterized protein DUF4365
VKRIPKSGITGQEGVALIQRIVLKMGCLWHPTGGLEAGIDGFIEFRDPATGNVLNLLLPVQSKATDQPFASESDSALTYICNREDLDYWMHGNKPIVLIISRPRTDEAYWVSLKDYFADPARRQSRKIRFDKVTDRFGVEARDRLLKVAVPTDSGTYFAPLRRPETIFSNLLRVSRLPERLYHADTIASHGGEIRRKLREAGAVELDEWSVRAKRIVSVYDLRRSPWRDLVDLGTVEEFGVEDWARAYDADKRSDFLDLLHHCLRARLRAESVWYDPKMDHFYFGATGNLEPRKRFYRSIARDSNRVVFQAYPKKDGSGEIAYYRHNAFSGRFRHYDGDWYLQIEPTYRFTSDGRHVHPYYESKLKGILAQEKNPAVLGQVVMWADVLSDPVEQPTLFSSPVYPHLGFSGLARFESPVGINDDFWLSSDESEQAKEAADQASDLTLFDGPSTAEAA